MAKVGDQTHTAYGLGTITEIDTVRGRSQFRVAGRGFNVWLDETKVHTAGNESEGLFSYGPMMAEADKWAHTPQAWEGGEDFADSSHYGGLETTIDPGGDRHVNERNHTTLPYDYTPQYPVDMFADEQTIQPGDYEIDADERLHPSDSLSGNQATQRKGPGPDSKLFATAAWHHGDPVDYSGGYPMDPNTGEDLSIDPRPRATNPDYLQGGGRVPDPTGEPLEEYPLGPGYERPGFGPGDIAEYEDHLKKHNYDWAPGYTPDEQDVEDRSHLQHPESGELAPGESWGHVGANNSGLSDKDYEAFLSGDPAYAEGVRGMHGPAWKGDWQGMNPVKGSDDYYDEDEEDDAREAGRPLDEFGFGRFEKNLVDRHHGSTYRPAGLSSRYAYFETEAAEDSSSPVAQFRRDPVAYIELCGHLWTDGDESLEKYADYTQLIDIEAAQAGGLERTAAWKDVRQKAQRLRHEGRVHVNDLGEGRIYATVEGDHGTYDTMIAKGGSMGGFGGGQSITNWNCSCEWGRWAFKRRMTYIGRLCSHGYAAYLTMQSNDITPEHFKPKSYYAKTSGVVEDYKTWLKDNDQTPEASSVAAFLHTTGQSDLDEEDVDKLYDYISDNPAQSPARSFDVDYTNDPDEAYKTGMALPQIRQPLSSLQEGGIPFTADLLYTKPRSLTPDLHEVPEGEEETWTDVTRDDRKTTGPDQIVHFSAVDTLRALHGVSQGVTDFAMGGSMDDGLGWGKGDAPAGGDTTGSDAAAAPPQSDPSAQVTGRLHYVADCFDPNIDPTQRPPSNSCGAGGTPPPAETPPPGSPEGQVPPGPLQVGNYPFYGTPKENQSQVPGALGGIPGMGLINSVPGVGMIPRGGSNRYAESSPAELLERLRDISTTPAADDLGHMDSRNDEVRDLVDELNDRGVDASFMVAAVEKEIPNDASFEGISSPDWADEAFSGSGPDPKDWISDSAGYVEENERPHIVDKWYEGDDKDIIKFNDSRSKPQQGPKKSSHRQADNFGGGGGETRGDAASPANIPAIPPPDPTGLAGADSGYDPNTTLASLHFADDTGAFNPSNPGADDWENASGAPFMQEVQKDMPKGPSQPGKPPGDPADPADPAGEEGAADAGEAAAGGGAEAGGAAAGGEAAEGLMMLLNRPSRPTPSMSATEYWDSAPSKTGSISDDDIFGAAATFRATGSAPGGGIRGVQRQGRGSKQQIRIDPGPRGQQRPMQASFAPPEDFGNDGIPEVSSYGGGADSDILANFHRSGAAEAVMSESRGSSDDFSSSPMVQSFLRTAGRTYTAEEQRELEAEAHPQGARNLPTDEDLAGTHYLLGL